MVRGGGAPARPPAAGDGAGRVRAQAPARALAPKAAPGRWWLGQAASSGGATTAPGEPTRPCASRIRRTPAFERRSRGCGLADLLGAGQLVELGDAHPVPAGVQGGEQAERSPKNGGPGLAPGEAAAHVDGSGASTSRMMRVRSWVSCQVISCVPSGRGAAGSSPRLMEGAAGRLVIRRRPKKISADTESFASVSTRLRYQGWWLIALYIRDDATDAVPRLRWRRSTRCPSRTPWLSSSRRPRTGTRMRGTRSSSGSSRSSAPSPGSTGCRRLTATTSGRPCGCAWSSTSATSASRPPCPGGSGPRPATSACGCSPPAAGPARSTRRPAAWTPSPTTSRTSSSRGRTPSGPA